MIETFMIEDKNTRWKVAIDDSQSDHPLAMFECGGTSQHGLIPEYTGTWDVKNQTFGVLRFYAGDDEAEIEWRDRIAAVIAATLHRRQSPLAPRPPTPDGLPQPVAINDSYGWLRPKLRVTLQPEQVEAWCRLHTHPTRAATGGGIIKISVPSSIGGDTHLLCAQCGVVAYVVEDF